MPRSHGFCRQPSASEFAAGQQFQFAGDNPRTEAVSDQAQSHAGPEPAEPLGQVVAFRITVAGFQAGIGTREADGTVGRPRPNHEAKGLAARLSANTPANVQPRGHGILVARAIAVDIDDRRHGGVGGVERFRAGRPSQGWSNRQQQMPCRVGSRSPHWGMPRVLTNQTCDTASAAGKSEAMQSNTSNVNVAKAFFMMAANRESLRNRPIRDEAGSLPRLASTLLAVYTGGGEMATGVFSGKQDRCICTSAILV